MIIPARTQIPSIFAKITFCNIPEMGKLLFFYLDELLERFVDIASRKLRPRI